MASNKSIIAGVTAGTAACGSAMAIGIERLAGACGTEVGAGARGAVIGMVIGIVASAVTEIGRATVMDAADRNGDR